MKQYEAMFLFDPTFAADFGPAKAEVERILGRANAEITFLEKWEERKLAYEIQGRKRGVYVLCYFKCDQSKVVGVERDAQLSEAILRILVKTAEGITNEQIQRYMPTGKRAEDASDDDDAPVSRSRGSDRDNYDGDAKPQRASSAVAVAEAPDDDSDD
ncbi:MAG: 30S ribosomal protein S6 [Phycisphaerales bacterium]|nr:30S ribosomal protein S6 [Phycisphaerales bacterium]